MKTIIAIIAIVILEIVAMLMGFNGHVLATSTAMIAALGGYEVAKHTRKE